MSTRGLPWTQGNTPAARREVSSYTPIPEESRVPPLPGNNSTSAPPRERDLVTGNGLGTLFIAIQCPPPRQVLRWQRWAQRAALRSRGTQEDDGQCPRSLLQWVLMGGGLGPHCGPLHPGACPASQAVKPGGIVCETQEWEPRHSLQGPVQNEIWGSCLKPTKNFKMGQQSIRWSTGPSDSRCCAVAHP